MRHTQLKLSGILLLVLSVAEVHAQTIYAKEETGTQTAYALSNVRKLTFSSGNMIITESNNNADTYALDGLRYLNFHNISTGVTSPSKYSAPDAYPNPTSDVLTIDLSGTAGQKTTLELLSFDGAVVKTQEAETASLVSLDLADLPQGIYLCRYNNGSETKAIKIIKQ